MARGGRPREGGIRRRMCLGCRLVREKHQLVRLALGPGGLLRDEKQALCGRGAYVCREEPCAAKAARQLSKALRAPGLHVSPAALWAVIEGQPGPARVSPARRPDPDETVG
jgi:predicted RNA-binding protein YlxR (DUF448 family)